MTTHSSILAWRIPKDRGAWRAIVHGVRELDRTEQLSTAQSYLKIITVGNSLAVQWLGLHAFTAEGAPIPDQGTKILQVTQ